MVPKRDGEIDTKRAARLAGVKRKTARTWALNAWKGKPTQCAYGRKDPNGQLFLKESEVIKLAEERAERERRIQTQALPDKYALVE